MRKILFFDVETTGLIAGRNAIHQISGIVDIDGQVVDEFNYHVQPHAGAVIDPEALKVGGVTEAAIMDYPEPSIVYKAMISRLSEHVNKFDKTDKLYLSGFNNARFDNEFLRAFWEKNNDKYFGSWFWPNPLDVMILASEAFIDVRPKMPNFKLATVARECGFAVLEAELHNSMYDVQLTREIYYHVQKKNNLTGDI